MASPGKLWVSRMEVLQNGITLEICEDGFPLSTDSMALGEFVRLPKNSAVLDLGSGCGTLGLLLCARDPGCQVTGVEISQSAHRMALHNSQVNGLTSRLGSICADLREIPQLLSPGSFSVCVSNPPYFAAGPHSKAVPLARREDLCSLEDLFRSAAWALRYGGDFSLVHRPERLAELCAVADRHGLQPKRLRLLRHSEDGPICLILLQCRKGGKPGLILEEAALHHADGSQTDYYRTIYHIE